MTQQYTYDFTNDDGNTSEVVVTTSSTATNDTSNGLGYDVLSISGTFDGKVISGMEGASGQNQYDDNVGPWDNVIFTDNTQGSGGSADGIDQQGIALTTADGQAYGIYSNGLGSFDDQTLGEFNHSLTLDSFDSPSCYCDGTRILTHRGEIAVENLRAFDLAVTASGELKPIIWIGHRSIDTAYHTRPEWVLPIRIAAGALGENRPVRDLLVSPEHALWLEDTLIPVRDLINGATIRQEPQRFVQYFHIELENHDIVLAEGVAAESYLDCGNRMNFDNAADCVAPPPPDWRSAATARRFASGAQTARLKRGFAERAREVGRGAEVDAFKAQQRVRSSATRTNFVRNPRVEGSVNGLLGAGGQTPVHWWIRAPDGVAVIVIGAGRENDLSFVDLRFVGSARAPGACCIYPDPGRPAAAKSNHDWTVSCYLRRVHGDVDGVEGVNLYIDECDANGVYLTGEGYAQKMPNGEDLMWQRMSATRRMSRPDVATMKGYVQIKVAVNALLDITLRIAGMQIEQGGYASDLILPPSGEYRASTRHLGRSTLVAADHLQNAFEDSDGPGILASRDGDGWVWPQDSLRPTAECGEDPGMFPNAPGFLAPGEVSRGA